ncbi:MAG: hypothetical protein LBB88_03720, partial [Planctomycetaceae bacterium]|nr:hypothetical protein [Planctomycetaceae bacterium]
MSKNNTRTFNAEFNFHSPETRLNQNGDSNSNHLADSTHTQSLNNKIIDNNSPKFTGTPTRQQTNNLPSNGLSSGISNGISNGLSGGISNGLSGGISGGFGNG